MKIKVVIADDHKIFREGLASLLTSTGIEIVGTAANGEEVLKLPYLNEVNVVITDVNMPDIDGVKLTRELRNRFKEIKIIALTMHNEGRFVSTMIKAGVNGYLLKDTGMEYLLDAIRAVNAGGDYFSAEIKNILAQSQKPGKKAKPIGAMVELSDREYEILKLISLENTMQQIAEKIFISEHTAIFHKRKLFLKFGVNNVAGLIKEAMDQGFIN